MDGRQMKQKLRQLKRLELRVRFGNVEAGQAAQAPLLWDDFFREAGDKRPKYPSGFLKIMDHETRKRIFAEYLYAVYYQSFKETGMFIGEIFDPAKLASFDLPPEASAQDIKRRFRELAKTHHPDRGGSHEAMIALLEEYNRLMKER